VALLPLLGACATRKDVRLLREEVTALRAAQDSSLRVIQRQNRMVLDSLSSQQTRTRGDLMGRIAQLDRQVGQVRELAGEGQQRVAELAERIAREREEAARQAAATAPAQPDTATAVPANPEEVYNAALASLRRGSLVTARAGFQEFLRLAPQHRLAADAHFYVGETYAEGKDVEQALAAYARVVQQHPSSPRAATALYRSGTLEAARGNRTKARDFFSRVVQSHANSPEAPLARRELQRLRS
jgi:tol-pal system protein YbgF